MSRLSAKKIRVLLGILLLAAVGGLFGLDYWTETRSAVSFVTVVVGLAGFWEFGRLSGVATGQDGGSRSLFLWGLVGTGYFLSLPFWAEAALSSYQVAGVFGVVLGAFVLTVFRFDFAERFPGFLAVLFGTILFGLLFSYILLIYRDGSSASARLLRGVVFFLAVKGTDIVAYLIGSAVGRHHFLKISPGKTLAGSLAALAYGAAALAVAGAVWPQHFFEWPVGILFGIILGLTSSLGDLLGSLIKRYYRVKDSGRLLPEFGGVLDLIDSFFFSAYVFWYLLVW